MKNELSNPSDCRVSPLSGEMQTLAYTIRDQVDRLAGQAEAVGQNLLRARELAKRGQWTPFLEASGISERTAQRLMQFARAQIAGKVPAGMSRTAFLEGEAEAAPKQPEVDAAAERLADALDDAVESIRAMFDAAEGDKQWRLAVLIVQHLGQFFDEGPPPSETGKVREFVEAMTELQRVVMIDAVGGLQ